MKLEASFAVALIIYTIVIWSHWFKKELKLWMIWLFAAALSIDGFATLVVCVLIPDKLRWTFHAMAGLASLLIMALHFFWAVRAYSGDNKYAEYFQRYSIYAWLFWLAAFLSGIPLSG